MQGWLRLKPAAKYCNISERLLHEWLKGGLRSCKVGGCLLIKVEWIDEFIQKFEVQNTGKQVDEIVNEVMKDF